MPEIVHVLYTSMQLRTQLGEAFEKQQKSEHEREAVEMKVLEVSVGVNSLFVLSTPFPHLAERHRLKSIHVYISYVHSFERRSLSRARRLIVRAAEKSNWRKTSKQFRCVWYFVEHT